MFDLEYKAIEEHVTYSPEQTQKLAAKFASSLKPGDVVGLVGQLGVGKTQFVKGMAQYFGYTENVTSPTFVLMQIYSIEGKDQSIKQLCHVDAYRIASSADILNTGIEEYLGRQDSVVVVEWEKKIVDIMPQNTIYIEFSLGTENENKRLITIKKPEK